MGVDNVLRGSVAISLDETIADIHFAFCFGVALLNARQDGP